MHNDLPENYRDNPLSPPTHYVSNCLNSKDNKRISESQYPKTDQSLNLYQKERENELYPITMTQILRGRALGYWYIKLNVVFVSSIVFVD